MATDEDDTPVLDALTAMTLDSVERCGLDAHTLLLVRFAALAAINAPAISYRGHIEAGKTTDVDVTVEQVQDVLIAVAPIIGSARVMSATLGLTEALDDAIAAADEAADGG